MRPIFRKNTGKLQLDLSTESRTSSWSEIEFNERLRQKRSLTCLEQISQLDVGEKLISQTQIQQIMDAIKGEFTDFPDSEMPMGIIAACYLGHPYEVHTIEIETGTIKHYRVSEPLPPLLERARSIAQHPSYAYIEVYRDCLCAIDKKGEVSIVK